MVCEHPTHDHEIGIAVALLREAAETLDPTVARRLNRAAAMRLEDAVLRTGHNPETRCLKIDQFAGR